MRTLITIVMCLFFSLSYSQEKNVDLNAMQAKLTNVQLEIVALEEKISMIESRIEGMQETEVTPELQDALVNINAKLAMLKRVEFSTKEYLESQESPEMEESSNDIR